MTDVENTSNINSYSILCRGKQHILPLHTNLRENICRVSAPLEAIIPSLVGPSQHKTYFAALPCMMRLSVIAG